eukprot:TRINITY_DN3870_c0_g1_i2.p1 TRINITY_DN3870_c0_g1~~TRINITY_DN3870_c0_g1_i2.p1  ORF type:complete len:386 (+),score=44.57 TRINITY_DN3870_c0_g1_i2:575-1732(+)
MLQLWTIHSKQYDLRGIRKWHPGGSDILDACQGRDCTELFEASHALSHVGVHKLLEAYHVGAVSSNSESPTPPLAFVWSAEMFYAKLTRRVKEHFLRTKQHTKASPVFWSSFSSLVLLYLLAFYWSHVQGTIIAAVFSGILWMMVMLCGFHDASHQALSTHAWLNQMICTVVGHWGFWNHELWQQHHVYGHHSFTGLAHQDPDLHHAPYVRLSADIPYRDIHRLQIVWVYLLKILPNQYLGQVIVYLRAIWLNELFGLNVHVTFAWLPRMIELLSVIVHFGLPFFWFHWYIVWIWAIHWTMAGLVYFVVVAPNHDTERHCRAQQNTRLGFDWGVHQIMHSANFKVRWRLISLLIGGMNYQIEHHLFPTVCSEHYPAIAPIVRQVC